MKITFIIGLPGSGKSTFIKQYENDAVIIDDPKKKDIVNIQETEWLIISDPNFCNKQTLNNAKKYLENKFSNLYFEYIYFENDVENCINNINHRNERMNAIYDVIILSKKYVVPNNEIILPVYKQERYQNNGEKNGFKI